MNTLLHDLRYAIRTLAKSPMFTAAAVVSLAIGIGANTAVFSIASALLLRPLPYKDAGRLVILWNRSPGLNIAQDWFSPAQYLDIKNGHHGFEQLAIAIGGNYNLTGQGEPERIGAVRVSTNLFPMLGARAALGRLFVTAEDAQGSPASALLTYGMWMRRYGGDAQIVGRSISLNGLPYQVVGILPQTFSLPREVLPTLYGADQPEIFLPIALPPGAAQIRTHEDYNLMGKLKPGVSVDQAQAEMNIIIARLRHDYPESYPPSGGLTFSIVPLMEQVVGDVRGTIFILLGAVGFVLLIACANVANLLLARAVSRQKEIAVRRAMGAGALRIVGQLLTESVLLAICGGAFGVLLSMWGVSWILLLGSSSVPRLNEVGVNGQVLAFTLLVSIFSGILFGLAPAFRVLRLDLYSTLKDASRGSAGASTIWGRGNNLRRVLVVSGLALSVVLLIGAGLLIRSFGRLEKVPPGFNPQNVLTFELTMAHRKYADPPAILNTYRQLFNRLEALPGVTAAGGITALPLSQAFAWTPITVEGRDPPAGEKFINADMRVVSGRYFQAMQIPLRRGRFFNEDDTTAHPRVVMVDERMAEQFWPHEDAVGKRIHIVELKSDDPWQTIVGVVGRVKQDSLDSDPRIAFYAPQTQFPARAMTVVMRNGADPTALTAAVKNEVRSLDADLPLYNVRTMSEHVNESLARRRFSMTLLSLFAVLALALAMVGIYSLMAYLVNQGAREIGIRIALGATEHDILSLVVGKGLTLAFYGVAAGLAGAFVLTRFMQNLLFGIQATDPVTFIAVPLLLALVCLLASYIPARRAARIDPVVSLRSE
ncbi:MAG TPA: ABC transporter permease [Terriglobia bacterium]|nr:ABC transporter permease [Terriglobia bacterium]